jgi:3-dehydroquinate dehydratase/shikimate dehydrogenase
MLFACISGPTLADVERQMEETRGYADAFEFRLDRWNTIDPIELAALLEIAELPVLFTIRSKKQGGAFAESDSDLYALLNQAAAIGPDYLDIEFGTPITIISQLLLDYPDVKIIYSYHDFHSMPKSLDDLLASMMTVPADGYKIAVPAANASDALTMLAFVQRHAKQGVALSGLCMGEYGLPTRVLGPVVGSFADFAVGHESEKTAPGQLTLHELQHIYHYKDLNPQTKVYALLGGIVVQSPSHLTHNQVFTQLSYNGVYIKIAVHDLELEGFMQLVRELPFAGFSVTVPLKEEILLDLDAVSEEVEKIGASNTLVKKDEAFTGYNTDGKGALDALEEVIPVQGKQMVVLGAGGASRAVVFEAVKRGAAVTILNRTLARAEQLATEFQAKAGLLEDLQDIGPYDILVNTTSVGMLPEIDAMPIACQDLIAGAVVMDIITKPRETKLLKEALKKQCKVIYGQEMFARQAAQQFALWSDGQLDKKRVYQIIKDVLEASL